MIRFIQHRIVEFHETDAAGLVHFSNYFRYAEAAEHALFREIDFPMFDEAKDGFYGWPRVRAQAKYSAPIHCGDAIRVELNIREIKDKSIVYHFRIFRESDEQLVSKGTFATAYIFRSASDKSMTTINVPSRLAKMLAPYCE